MRAGHIKNILKVLRNNTISALWLNRSKAIQSEMSMQDLRQLSRPELIAYIQRSQGLVSAAPNALAAPPEAQSAVVHFAGVSKSFAVASGVVHALDDVTLNIRPGEFVCLVGASGCGKTTALRLAAGLEAASGGTIYLDGAPLREPSEKNGFVFQQPNLLPWRTILQNVTLPLSLRKNMSPSQVKERGMQMLERMGLADFANHAPAQLSGGMQQRAGIARALITEPELLLMDEPFGALDAITREQMNLELLRLWERSGKTVMFVTHSIAEAIFLADRVYAMTPRPGRIAAEFTVPFERPRLPSVMREAAFQDMSAEVHRAIGAEV